MRSGGIGTLAPVMAFLLVMAGLDPAIHVFALRVPKAWILYL
jgi:hypothetical protein